MSKSLTEGELLQLHAGQSMWISEKQYYQIIEQKTACLFAACSEAGAASTGATSRQMTAMRNYGLHLGMCFQLKDDILDFSDAEDIGKPTMNDIQDGKATLPLLISLQRASKEEAQSIRTMAEALASKSTDISTFEAEQDI
jgi:octaprenyl-diphosphate synthase